MIVFDLICGQNHVFEAWFGSSKDYENQKASGLIECPMCFDDDVRKAVMAPSVGRKGNQAQDVLPAAPGHQMATGSMKDMVAIMTKLQRHVESNFENVGQEFPEEARKIHYGETEERGIYGEASPEETKALLDEGVDVFPMPKAPKEDA